MAGKMKPEDANRFASMWMQAHADGADMAELARRLGNLSVRGVYDRRRKVEAFLQTTLPGLGRSSEKYQYTPRHTTELEVTKPTTYLVASDLHFWPDHEPFCWHVLLEAVRVVKPDGLILNGDIFDFPSVSRFGRNAWESRPTIAEELDWGEKKLRMLTRACQRRGIEQHLTIGNHDIRFERYLAKNAEQLEGLTGTTLDEKISEFDQGWKLHEGLFLNPEGRNPTMIRHTVRAGIHDAYNSTVHGGVNTVTGHTHHLSAKHKASYRGVTWGITSGFIGEPYGPQFDYTAGAPVDWVPGFIALHIDGEHFDFDLFPVVGNKARVWGKIFNREDFPCG